LGVEEGRTSLYCTYCGAGLKIMGGASGYAVATLDDIKVDTSFLAGQAALTRLAACRRETTSPPAGLMINWFPA
jgi:hypothetical protein